MQLLIDIASFLGSWLLVAGPIYQAALELDDQDLEIDRLREVRQSLPPADRVSPWWWLVPPVQIYLARRSNEKYKKQYFEALTDDDALALLDFRAKALGWLMVAAGGLMIATKETYELWEHFSLPVYVLAIVIVFMALLSVIFTVSSTIRRHKISDKRSR